MNSLFPVGALAKTGAAMARGKSKQDYETPDDFFKAVVNRFGSFFCDLAATMDNRKVDRYIGPDTDSLKQDWTLLRFPNSRAKLWLNPPFADIAPWAEKCLRTSSEDDLTTIVMLTPASIGANWFRDHVHGKALVLGLNGRLTFKGTDAPYPKDCMLSVFGVPPGFNVWNWRAA